MMTMIALLAVFFFLATLAQLAYLNWQIAHPPVIAPGALMNPADCARPGGPVLDPQQCLAVQQRRAIYLLEENVLARRYHQSNGIVMFSVWSRYLGFVTGMILAFVGSAFILGKLTGPASDVSAARGDWKFAASSASPGLVMSALGVVLMIVSITTLHSLTTRDGPTYLGLAAQEGGDSPSGVKLKPEPGGNDGAAVGN
jgi:hypothetical protein